MSKSALRVDAVFGQSAACGFVEVDIVDAHLEFHAEEVHGAGIAFALGIEDIKGADNACFEPRLFDLKAFLGGIIDLNHGLVLFAQAFAGEQRIGDFIKSTFEGGLIILEREFLGAFGDVELAFEVVTVENRERNAGSNRGAERAAVEEFG